MMAEGYTSAEAIAAINEVAAETLPTSYGYEYGGISREEAASTSSGTLMVWIMCIVLIYLILCALYESYFVPLAVILAVPCGLMGSFLFAKLCGIENNIYLQTGVIMLIGLLSKTAILLTEYASARRARGMGIEDAAYDAAKTPLLSLYLFLDSLYHLVLSDYVFTDEFPFIAIGAMSFEDSGNVRFGQDIVGIAAFWLSLGLIFLFYCGARTQGSSAVMPLSTKLNAYLIVMAALGLITGLFSCLLTDVYTQRYATEVVFVFSIISLLLILHYVRFASDFSSKLVYLFFVGALLQTCAIGALGGAIGSQQFRLNPEGLVELINIFRPFA